MKYRNQILCGDCREVMKSIPDDVIELVFFDPPYNVCKKYDTYSDNLPHDEYLYLLYEVATECTRIATRGMVIFAKAALVRELLYLLPEAHLIIVHKRAKGVNTKANYSAQYFVIVATARPIERLNDLWNDIRLPGEGYYFREEKFHQVNPGFTSLLLTERVIESFSVSGDLILDPFMGIGTTAVACQNLGRDYVGIELSPKYCKIAENRIKRNQS